MIIDRSFVIAVISSKFDDGVTGLELEGSMIGSSTISSTFFALNFLKAFR